MKTPFGAAGRAVLLGVLTLGSAGNAVAQVTVTRCNAFADGAYRPVLVIGMNGSSTTFTVGEGGLTRSIAFSPSAALEWAAQHIGDAAGPVSYQDCNTGASTADYSLPIDTDCGGDDCGGGDCGGGDCGGGDCGGGDCGGGDCGGLDFGDCGGFDSVSGLSDQDVIIA